MQSESPSRHFANVGTLVQGAIVIGAGIYAMALALYWLFTN